MFRAIAEDTKVRYKYNKTIIIDFKTIKIIQDILNSKIEIIVIDIGSK